MAIVDKTETILFILSTYICKIS